VKKGQRLKVMEDYSFRNMIRPSLLEYIKDRLSSKSMVAS
jgi:hypothetical protein